MDRSRKPIDFVAIKENAVARVEPFWERAEAERRAATELGKRLREIDLKLSALKGTRKKTPVEGKKRDLKGCRQEHEEAAKAVQREADAIYWPICNLDLKNPYAKTDPEHADPKDLIATMRAKEQDVMRLLAEIETLVNETSA